MAVVNTIPLAAVVIIASLLSVAVGVSNLEFDVASQGFQEFYSGMKKALIAAGATHLQQSHLGAGGHALVLPQLKTHGADDVLLRANGLEFDAASQGFPELCSGMEKVIAAIANHLQPSYLGAGVLVLPRLMKTQEANDVLLLLLLEQLDNLLKTHDNELQSPVPSKRLTEDDRQEQEQ